MNTLEVWLAEGRTGYRPGELLRGAAAWDLARAPVAMEARLCWFVDVQGDPEVRRVQTVRFDRPPARDRRDFEFRLPDAPCSYAGALTMLGWAVEAVALPHLEFAQVFFSVGPGGEVVDLNRQLE